MNVYDEEAFVREMQHKEMVANQVMFAGGHSYEVPECIYSNEIYATKDGKDDR